MLVANIDVSNGLVNGAREVVHIVTNVNSIVFNVLVKFDNRLASKQAHIELTSRMQCL